MLLETKIKLRKRLYAGIVPANKEYAAGTVPANKEYAASTVPANKEYPADTLKKVGGPIEITRSSHDPCEYVIIHLFKK